MRFFLYINPQTRGQDDDRLVIEAVTQQAIEADAAGFDAIFLTEHHFTNYNAFSDPFMFGAYLAPQIRRARIGFSVAVPPLHHPLRFAEHCNLLDQFTNGRAIFGVGVGGGPIEFAGFGRRSADRISESSDAVQDTAAFKERAMIYGSPDSVARQIQTYADVGVTGMMLWLTWGSNDPERVRRSMRLFVDEVMPRFAQPCTSSSLPSISC